MEVILLERVEKLGQMGDEVKVRPGFARNYLLPQKKALRATKENRQHFERERAQLEAENLKRRQEAEDIARRMDGVRIVVVRQASEMGNLYGSVSARDIAGLIGEQGFTIGRGQVIIDKPIKSLGIYDIRVQLHPEVDVTIAVNVARSEDEAQQQAKTGSAVIGVSAMEQVAREAEAGTLDAEADTGADAAGEQA